MKIREYQLPRVLTRGLAKRKLDGFSQNLYMPHIKVYIHLVWTTKDRLPLLFTPEIRIKVWKHIKQNADEKGIFIDSINGFAEHCHCLLSLSSNQTIEKVAQLIKGESSFWINKEKLNSRTLNLDYNRDLQ